MSNVHFYESKFESYTEAYFRPCEIFKDDFFGIIVNVQETIIYFLIFAKSSIINVRQGPK